MTVICEHCDSTNTELYDVLGEGYVQQYICKDCNKITTIDIEYY